MFKAWVTTAPSRDGSHICAGAAASMSLTNCTPLPHCTPVSMSNMVATLQNLTTFGTSPTFKKDTYSANQVSWYLQGKTPKTQRISTGLSFEKDV